MGKIYRRLSGLEQMEINLTPKEVAKRLRLNIGTLSNWRGEGKGPRFLKFGRKILYPISEIELFERKHTHLTRTEIKR